MASNVPHDEQLYTSLLHFPKPRSQSILGRTAERRASREIEFQTTRSFTISRDTDIRSHVFPTFQQLSRSVLQTWRNEEATAQTHNTAFKAPGIQNGTTHTLLPNHTLSPHYSDPWSRRPRRRSNGTAPAPGAKRAVLQPELARPVLVDPPEGHAVAPRRPDDARGLSGADQLPHVLVAPRRRPVEPVAPVPRHGDQPHRPAARAGSHPAHVQVPRADQHPERRAHAPAQRGQRPHPRARRRHRHAATHARLCSPART
jgi:hypothetical protein